MLPIHKFLPNSAALGLRLNFDSVTRAAIALFPVGVVLTFCLPLVSIGTDSLSMIRYFNQDESVLVEFGIRMYENGLLPVEFPSSYPKFFYYLCGAFLYPFTLLSGPDPQVIAVTFRLANVAAMVLTVFFMNRICVKILRSPVTALISTVLFVSTPVYLHWGINSRPHPFELLLIVLSMYYSLLAVTTRQERALWVAVIWAGLATGTKLGGLFVIPTIVIVYTYLLHLDQSENWISRVKPQVRLGNTLSVFLGGLGSAIVAAVLYTIFNVQRSSTGITVAEELGWQNAVFTSPFNLGLVSGLFLAGIGVLFFLFNRGVSRLDASIATTPGGNLNRGSIICLLCHKATIFGAKVLLAVAFIFLITNPDFLVFPKESIWVTLKRVYISSHGTDFQRDQNYLAWFSSFHRTSCMGIAGVAIVGFYFLLETMHFFSKEHNTDSRDLFVRLAMLSYPITLVGFLSLVVQHRPYHYLLPAILFLFILGADALVRVNWKMRRGRQRNVFQVSCTILVLLCVGERFPEFLKQRARFSSRSSDPAISELGPWLTSSYPESVEIMTDSVRMYIPDTFTNLYYWKGIRREWGRLPGIRDESYRGIVESPPAVFVRSEFDDLMIVGEVPKKDLAYLESKYALVKRFPYDPQTQTWYRRGRDIKVYERKPLRLQ